MLQILPILYCVCAIKYLFIFKKYNKMHYQIKICKINLMFDWLKYLRSTQIAKETSGCILFSLCLKYLLTLITKQIISTQYRKRLNHWKANNLITIILYIPCNILLCSSTPTLLVEFRFRSPPTANNILVAWPLVWNPS